MAASVDLLCVKNDLYDEVPRFFGKKLKKSAGRYFDDGRGRRMLVLFDETTVPSVAETIRGASFKGKVKIYVFAHGDYAYNEEFEEVADKVELCALPAAIRNAYRRVIGKYRPQEEDAK
jgi:adenine-specific DNA-methyltransferase